MIAKVLVLLQEKKYALVKQAVLEMNAVDIAEVFAELHELEAPQTRTPPVPAYAEGTRCGDVFLHGKRCAAEHHRGDQR